MALILKVTPDQVKDVSNRIQTRKNEMMEMMNKMVQYVNSLSESWSSTSGDKYIEQYQNVQREIIDSLANLQRHVDHLVKASEEYAGLEQELDQKVSSLSDQNIF